VKNRYNSTLRRVSTTARRERDAVAKAPAKRKATKTEAAASPGEAASPSAKRSKKPPPERAPPTPTTVSPKRARAVSPSSGSEVDETVTGLERLVQASFAVEREEGEERDSGFGIRDSGFGSWLGVNQGLDSMLDDERRVNL